MNILIKSAKIIDVNSKYHNKNYDILIQDSITHIDKIINPEKLNLKKNLVCLNKKFTSLQVGLTYVNFGELYEQRNIRIRNKRCNKRWFYRCLSYAQ